MRTAHLADAEKPLTTLCGEPWEPWQEPDMPTDEEIGFDALSYGARVAVHESDKAREGSGLVRQCGACLKWAMRVTA